MIALPTSPQLRPYVRQLWHVDAGAGASTREHVLPTGQMHLVFRLSGPPLRTYADAADQAGTVYDGPVVGGPRAGFYVKETGAPVTSIGVQLLPGAAQALFGVSAGELAGAHTSLADLWGAQGWEALERIAEAGTPDQQLRMLDLVLCARLRGLHGLHPQVAQALGAFRQGLRIDTLVRDSRYSHRGFIAVFRQATGFTPKRYARMLRFQEVLAALRRSPVVALGELALDAGYSDQAHLNREFREFTGMTPLQYRLLAPPAAHHVPLAPP